MKKREARKRWGIVLALGLLVLFSGAGGASAVLAQDAINPEEVLPTGNAKVITVLVTRISSDRVVTIEVFPQTAEVNRGDTVLWLNAVPGAMASVTLDGEIPVAGHCGMPARPASMSSGGYTSGLFAPGNASSLCFSTPGKYSYRVIISTQGAGASLNAMLVVR